MLVDAASPEGERHGRLPAALQWLQAGSAWLRTSVAPLTAVIALLCFGAWLTGWEVVRYIDNDRTQFFLRHKTHPILLHNTIGGGKQFQSEERVHQPPAAALGALAPPDGAVAAPAAVLEPAIGANNTGQGEILRVEGAVGPRLGWNASLQAEGSHPRVYILPISQQFTCQRKLPHECAEYSIYGAEILIPDQLAASNHVTDNPAEADFFLVPAHFYTRLIQLYDRPGELPSVDRITQQSLERELLAHVKEDFPFYEPRRAIWTLTHDHGFCGFATGEGTVPELGESIILSHWGLTVPEINCDWRSRLRNFGACRGREHPHQLEPRSQLPCFVPDKDVVIPTSGMDNFHLVDVASWGIPGLENRTVRRRKSMIPGAVLGMQQAFAVAEKPDLHFTFPLIIYEERFASYPRTVEQRAKATELLQQLQAAAEQLPQEQYDVVLAKTSAAWTAAFGSELNETLQALPGSTAIRRPKQNVLFFRGGVRLFDPAYSHGVRQALVTQLKGTPGFNFGDTGVDESWSLQRMLQEMGRSHFCLAASGAGWGVRLKQSLLAGCVPVIIADEVQMEFEDVLPYKDFAVRMPQHALYWLPVMLDSLLKEDGLVDAMTQRGACAFYYLTWHQQHGRALQALMCSLRQRLWGKANVRPVMDWERCELSCPVAGQVALE